MALPTPSIQEIAESIVSDIESKTNQTIPSLAKSVFNVLSLAIAGVWIILYKYGSWQFNQIFPQLADEKFLELLGENKRIFRTPAVAWVGDVDITVLADSDIDAGTQLVNNATGIIYLVQTTEATTTPTHTSSIQAATAGEIGDLQVGAVLDFVNPPSTFGRQATVSAVTTAGSDKEDLEVYRGRVVDAYQKQPQGGALADYEQWANETANVINTYPYAGSEPPDVDVYIEVDNQTDGIPTAGQKAAALANINFDPITGRATRRPVTANVTVLGITRTAFDVEITGLSPDTSEIRSAIQDGVEQYFTDKEPFILGLSVNRVDKITLSGVTAAAENIASANSATFTTLDLELAASPITSYTLGTGEKAKLNGNITWTP
jgi:uncharacterized phage protein gp47/JayE